jgi:hypothetical protein
MGHIKTFYQLFESSVQLRPSHYWYFVVFFPDKRIGNTRAARFLVSGDSTKTITTEFLENLLPRYLGFDSLYTLSPDVAPPVINGFMQFGDWVHENIDEISDRAGVEKIYINGREIANGLDFPEFLDAFGGEETNDNYTEMYGEPNPIAWLIMNHFRTNREGEIKGKYELNEIFEFFNEPVGNSIGKNNHLLKIGEKYSEVLDQIFDSKDADWIYDYFKNNPLELYIVEFPKIKEKILLKTGIKDYSDIGRKLKKGLI